jgi:N-acyl-D-amino-acid deacylase
MEIPSDSSRIPRRSFLAALATAGAGALVAGCRASQPSVDARPSLDLLIRNGTVIDGTGAEGVLADVAVRGDRIVAVGPLPDAIAARVIDARGLTVTPGFVDIHSHTDESLLRSPKAESKVMQGVTTEVGGQDGDSPAPIGGPTMAARLDAFRAEFGRDCPYRDMDGFLSALARNGSAQNVVMMVGLGTVRGVVVGMDNRPATPDEIRAMQQEAVKAVEQGCWGASTGLEYTPGSFATREELAEVMKAIPGRRRLYATHMRNEDARVLEAIEESIAICRGSGARLQVSHLKAQNRVNWPKQQQALDMLDAAIASGLEVHVDRYPYIAFSTGLQNLFPITSRDGGDERFVSRLKDPATLASLRPTVLKKVDGLGSWESVMISSVRGDDARKYLGKTVQEISVQEKVDPFEFVVDLLVKENANVGMVGFGMDEAGTELVLRWKNAMVASDGGAYSPASPSRPHPRAYGTFPRAIRVYSLERKTIPLPGMIRKMTSLPAEKIGLSDRGVIAVGNAADLVVFDPTTIRDEATYSEPHRFPTGIRGVIVNGVEIVRDGVQQEVFPGRVLRSPGVS